MSVPHVIDWDAEYTDQGVCWSGHCAECRFTAVAYSLSELKVLVAEGHPEGPLTWRYDGPDSVITWSNSNPASFVWVTP